jgi:WD40 repeat protein
MAVLSCHELVSVHSMHASVFQVNSLSFNPFNEWILATASGDTTINLFDMRKLSRSLHTFDSHEYVFFLCPTLCVQSLFLPIIECAVAK